MSDPAFQFSSRTALRAARLTDLSYLVWGWTLPDNQPIDGEIAGWRFPVGGEKRRKSRALHAYQSQISNLTDDDPAGFRLDGKTLDLMLSDDEAFLVNR
jgi:hypothetical protein